ncbi:MAG TPA: hypothetical protein PK446_08315, partial [Methanomassiliicoccaceae archaeon]|nr:hypothetical protein [Methanomassiliicoccaceae archaeon]
RAVHGPATDAPIIIIGVCGTPSPAWGRSRTHASALPDVPCRCQMAEGAVRRRGRRMADALNH